ncbi:MAG: DUF87 domain-containing protein [Candidatus Micrarchaeota archaeon]
MKPSYMLSKEIARKMILVHPPEPRKELLLANPSHGVYIGKTRFLHTPVFWDPSKLINPHIAVIGITGSGKSIDRNESVLVRMNNRVKLVKIGELIDTIISRSFVVSKIDDLEGIQNPGIEVFSFDGTLKSSWCKVLFAGRKSIPDRQYYFETASGRKITTTGDHNFVLLKDSKITMSKGTEVTVGDYIPLPRRVDYEGSLNEINLIDLLSGNDLFVSGAARLAGLAYTKKIIINQKYDKYLRFYKNGRSIPLDYFKQLLFVCPEFTDHLSIKATKSKKYLPAIISKDKLPFLFRLLGYITAEGCITKRTVMISAMDEETICDITNCFTALDIPHFKTKTAVISGSKVFFKLVQALGFFGKSHDKHMGDILINSPKEYLSEYLSAYFEGDGGVDGVSVSCTTKSQELTNHLGYMLLRYGIVCRMHNHWKMATNSAHTGAYYHRISISGKQNIDAFKNQINFVSSAKIKKLEILCNKIKKESTNVDIIPNVSMVFEAVRERYSVPRTQMTYSIKSGLRKPSRSYIHSFVNSVGSPDDSDHEFLKLLSESDLFWDRIVAKREIETDGGFVYDLTTENEVFMAGFGGLFVHNSYTVKTFLTRASLIWNTNAIILDWVGEYEPWVKQAGGKVINLAKEKLNILDLVGLPKRSRIKQIMSALDILLDLKSYPNERDEIEEALETVYYGGKGKAKTKKEDHGPSKMKPTLNDVVKLLETSHKKKAARLLKRFTAEGTDFFAGTSTMDIKKLTSSGLVCIDLHDLPSEEMRSLAGLTILQYIKELMRAEGMQSDNKKVKLFVVLDEAWKIAQDERSDVIAIVREGRKYNFSLVIATQNPTDMHKTIFSNIGSVFVLRLILKEFRDYVRNSIGYSDFIDGEISKFGVGDAAVNMIFAERQTKVMTFLMDKIDGEEPLLIYKIKGGDMIVEVEREQFVRMLYEIGLNEGQLNMIKNEFSKGDGLLDGEQLVAVLEKFGYARPSIISFLRQLGIDEKNLIRVFSLVRMRKATKGVVNVVLEENNV